MSTMETRQEEELCTTEVRALRWGILSTANIAIKVIDGMHKSPFAVPTAVASRSLDKAKKFAELTRVPKYYGSYDELLRDEEIDAIYIPVPTGLRTSLVFSAAKAKKHVLAEKPFLSSENVEEMRRVCQENGVMFMDNTMWLHHKRTLDIKQKVDMFNKEPGTVGALQKARASFNYNLLYVDPNNIRFDRALEPYGALGDLGWYCIGHILHFFNELPTKVWATADYSHDNDKDKGVIVRCDGVLWFSHGRKASFDCSFLECTIQDAEYITESSIVRVHDFVIPFENDPFAFPREKYDATTRYTESNDIGITKQHVVDSHTQHAQVFDDFAVASISPLSKESQIWAERTLGNMRVLDALFQSAYTEQVVQL